MSSHQLAVAAVVSAPVVYEPIVLASVDRDQLLADTKAFAAAESAPGVPMEAVVREGSTAAEILDQAASMKADLLVIGTHGRSGFERLLLGSVTERLLRKASCPVMTVPRRLPDAVPAGPVLYKQILCPVDFSESSLQALRYAISMAQEADGHLTVLHVVEHEFQNPVGVVVDAGMTTGDFLKNREEALRRRLDEVVRALRVLQSGVVDDPWQAVARSSARWNRATQ